MYWLGHPKKPTNCFNVSQGKTTKYATCWSRTTWHQENSKLARVQGERHSTPSKNVEWHRWYSIPQTQSHLTWGDANEKDGGLLFQKIVVSYLGYACPYYIFCILVYLSHSLSNNCRNVPPIHHAFVGSSGFRCYSLSSKMPSRGLNFFGPSHDRHTFQFQPGIRFCQHAIVEKGKTKKPLGSLKCASLKPAMEGHQKQKCAIEEINESWE